MRKGGVNQCFRDQPMAFAARMQVAADLDEVRSDLLAVAYQVMEPAHVSVWVRGRPG